ncbi:MAG TPA: serine hydrolase domain-containing protein [Armatimonadota bacterium]
MIELTRTVARLEQGIADGLHLGAQVYASLGGRTVADVAAGENTRGVPMTPDTLMLWQSCTKPIVAVAIAQLWERGLLDIDDPVAKTIPEFAQNGKEAVTLRHILTHTGGFRFVMLRWFSQTWEANFERICAAPLEPGWVPGQKAGYHPATSWFILAEVLRRLDGRPLEQYLRDEIFQPLSMADSWLSMTAERFYAYDERIGVTWETAHGVTKPAELVDAEDGCTRARPGSSGRGPARELGRFYEMLLHGGSLDGARILSPQTVAALTAKHRVGMFDHTFQCTVDWGLGFVADSKQYEAKGFPYGFGPYASPRSFGHGGSQSSLSFCDPDAGLVAVIIANGMPGEQPHNRRFRALTTAIYEDLGLGEG